MRYFVFFLFATLFLTACSTKDNSARESTADSISISGLKGDSIKLIKTAVLDFKVQNVFETSKSVRAIAGSFGGVITNREIESVNENSKELQISRDSVQSISAYIVKAKITVKVPSENLDLFLDSIASTASFINKDHYSIEDKSLEYLSSKNKVQRANEILRESRDKNLKPSEAVSLIAGNNDNVNKETEAKQIEANVNYSGVELFFSQKPLMRTELKANTTLDNYRLSFSNSLSRALRDGCDLFLQFIIMLAHLWLFIILGASAFLVFRYYRSKKNRVSPV